MEKEMPEGVKWPQFKAGGPVGIGDRFSDRAGAGRTVMYIKFYGGNFSICADDGTVHYYEYGEQVAPAPVIAADGKPLEVGQTVWYTKTGTEYRVLSLPDGEKGAWLENSGGKYFLDYAVLTHQRPVLDADGVPIELGDDLYSVEGGLKLRVSNIDRVNYRIATSAMFALDKWADPSMLTHTKPDPSDSWEKWREDFIKPPCVYCRDILGVEFDDDTDLDKAFDAQVQDMERRARALAERVE